MGFALQKMYVWLTECALYGQAEQLRKTWRAANDSYIVEGIHGRRIGKRGERLAGQHD